MVTRRSFLKNSSLATASGLLVGTWSDRCFAKPLAALERTTVGVIGIGRMGSGHLGKLLGNPEVEVVAVCDVVQERRESGAASVAQRYADRTKSGEYRGVKQFEDFRELLSMDGLDAVVIATPDHWHAIPCILAARSGKHIYCEKPLTHDIAEGRHLVDEVTRANVVFQTGSQQRSEFGGHFRKAVEAIWNGRIGDVQRVRIGVGTPPKVCDLPTQEIPIGTNWDLWVGPAQMRGYNEVLCPQGIHKHFPLWRSYVEFGGGGLADMGAHHFDIAQWALKMDTSAPTQIIAPEDPKAEHGLRFVYANGVEMIHNEFEEGIKADCVFEGTRGMILVSRNGISSRPGSLIEEPIGVDGVHVMASTNHHQNWLDAIRKGTQCICTAEIGHRSASICHLANIGYRLNRKLQWDPQAEKFLNDDEANQQLSREPREQWKI